MSQEQWGHGFHTGKQEGKISGLKEGFLTVVETQTLKQFWALEQVALQLIRLAKSESYEDRSEVVGLAEALVIIAKAAYNSQLKLINRKDESENI